MTNLQAKLETDMIDLQEKLTQTIEENDARASHENKRAFQKIENIYSELGARITACSSKFRESMKEFAKMKKEIGQDIEDVEIRIQLEIDNRLYRIGLDIEVPVWTSDPGDWEDARQHILPEVYKLDEFERER